MTTIRRAARTYVAWPNTCLCPVQEPTGDLKQLRQSLLDAETVAMDSKQESAFLKDENRKLLEKLVRGAGSGV